MLGEKNCGSVMYKDAPKSARLPDNQLLPMNCMLPESPRMAPPFPCGLDTVLSVGGKCVQAQTGRADIGLARAP